MSNLRSLLPKSFFEYPQVRFPSLLRDLEEEFRQQNWPFSNESDIEITADNNNLYVKVPVPGLDTSEIDITLDNGILWIKGEKRERIEDERSQNQGQNQGQKRDRSDDDRGQGQKKDKERCDERAECKERKVYRQSTRAYSYRIALPEQIDESREPTAVFNRGILEVTLPKAKQNQTKKITIKSK